MRSLTVQPTAYGTLAGAGIFVLDLVFDIVIARQLHRNIPSEVRSYVMFRADFMRLQFYEAQLDDLWCVAGFCGNINVLKLYYESEVDRLLTALSVPPQVSRLFETPLLRLVARWDHVEAHEGEFEGKMHYSSNFLPVVRHSLVQFRSNLRGLAP